MSVVQTSDPAPRGATASASVSPSRSPTPRRLRAPSWLNLRLVVGLLLVLVSVVVGARVVTAADSSDLVWAADADLAAGTVLVDGDLRTVPVRLADVADAYLLGSADPIGRVLSSPIRAGELLPRSVLEETSDLVDIALPVAAGYVPPNLSRGQLVDVYALDVNPTQAAPGATTAPGPDGTAPESPASEVVTVVVRAAVVQLISGRSDGALSVGSSTIQVVISVEAEQATDLFAAIAGRELALAVRSSSGPAPTTDQAERDGGARTPTTPTPTPTP